MKLRPYQDECISAVCAHLANKPTNPCAVIPTGGGKTPVIGTICAEAVREGMRVASIAHVKELVDHAAQAVRRIDPQLPVGIYSAGLKARDLGYPITCAGIQSVYGKACDLGKLDIILIDEAHMIPFNDEGMYRQFLADARIVNPGVRVIGLTATPFRMKGGMICGPDNILNEICYEVGVAELVEAGFLSRLRSKQGQRLADFGSIAIRGGEFLPTEAEKAMDQSDLVDSAVREIIEYTQDRQSVLIFCQGVKHALHVSQRFADLAKIDVPVIDGGMLGTDRDDLLARFKSGRLKYLCNVNILTTGFDAPRIDCVVLLRATKSPGLYYQMVGRGFRLSPETGKADCLVLDFGGNILRHGPVDRIEIREPSKRKGNGEPPLKACPQCHEFCLAQCRTCPACWYEFPIETKPSHAGTATDAAILSGDRPVSNMLEVSHVEYARHERRDAFLTGAPPTLRVDYVTPREIYKEWICIEHDGFAGVKAQRWWQARTVEAFPESVDAALQLANAGCLAVPTHIIVTEKKGDYPRVTGYRLGPKPMPLPPPEPAGPTDDFDTWGEIGADGEGSLRGDEVDVQVDDIPF